MSPETAVQKVQLCTGVLKPLFQNLVDVTQLARDTPKVDGFDDHEGRTSASFDLFLPLPFSGSLSTKLWPSGLTLAAQPGPQVKELAKWSPPRWEAMHI